MDTPKNDAAPVALQRSEAIQQKVQMALSFADEPAFKPPLVTGQCAQVLALIREHQPLLSLELTANHAIPETAARVHDLRAMGWNIITTILPSVIFRGVERRNVALYSLGAPEWIPPGGRR